MKKLEEVLNTAYDADIGYFVEVDLKHPYNREEKRQIFPIASQIKIIPQDMLSDHMKDKKPDN